MNLNSIENLGIKRVLKRGTGEIIYRDNDVILVRDKVSKALLFACDDTKKGFIPFGQVEKDNGASLHLQKKIGMVCSENLITWMWR